MTEKLYKSKKRIKEFAEVFTPMKIVKEMCDNLVEHGDSDVFMPEKTFLDPAVGTGNFLVEILERKLKHCKDWADVITSLQSMYAVDIQADNVEETRQRLFELTIKLVLEQNIIVGDFLKIADKLDNYFTDWRNK